MRAIVLLIGLFVATVLPLHAQTIRVQSGDHAGFTRLVMPIGAEREWTLNPTPDGFWELVLTPSVDGFDTSTAFNLIQRNRLVGLSGQETLSLELACDCEVSSFRHDSRFLVVDIADPDPNAVPAEPDIEDVAIEERAEAAAALPDLANLLRSPGNLPDVSRPLDGVFPNDGENGGTVPARQAEAPNPRVAEAAEIMAEQLARAAASGLLDAALNQPVTPSDPVDAPATAPRGTGPHATVEPSHGDTRNPHPDLVMFPDGRLPITAETAFDTGIQLDLPIGPPRPHAACDGVPFRAADWSEGGGLHVGLGALRRDLYDERDRLTRDGTISLAQHYLFYGFGAEAAFWLNQLDQPPQDLLHIAALLDGARTASFAQVETPDDCSDGELLWRYMAGAVPGELNGENIAALQRGYSDLPIVLRDNIGPRLARQLFADGLAGSARNVRDILHRGGRLDSAALQILDLDLGITLPGSHGQTQEALAEALRNDGSDPVGIMAHALAFDRGVGTRPNVSRLVAADALMREVGNGPETDDLWRETLLAYAALGQLDEALSRLADPVRNEAARTQALTELISERVTVGDTAALVVLAYTYGQDWRPEGSTAGRVQVRAVAALREEGLFEAAQILRDVRRPLILPAPAQAPAEVTDEAATAWLAADWPLLAEVGEGPHAEIAARLARLEAAPAVTPALTGAPDLNALNATVNDSRALRSAVADLLARPTPP